MDDWFGFNDNPGSTNPFDVTPRFIRNNNLRQTTAVPLSSKVNLDVFSGYSGENGQKFLDEFDSFCVLQGLTDDRRTIAAFHLHLKGPALVWFNALNSDLKSVWTLLRFAFINKYVTLDTFDSRTVAESALFDTMSLQDHQPLEGFHSDILEKGTRLQKPERDMIAKFINGLPHQLAFFVRAGNPQSFQEALQKAKLGEAYGYRSSGNVPTACAVKAEGNTMDQLVQRLDRLEARLTAVHQSDRPVRNTGHKDQKRKFACYNCAGEGHRKMQCNWNGTGPKDATVKCQICNQYGHPATSCKKFPVPENQ